jgi:molybdenum cofactor biosynthesis protein B
MSHADQEGGIHRHRAVAPANVATAVVTVSDTRTLETDTGGALVAELLAKSGHDVVSRHIVRDDPDAIRAAVEEATSRDGTRAVVLTGGTGVAPRDVTPESVEPLLERVIPGFGELFRMLSFEQVGAAAMLSRAIGGIAGGKPLFALPGAPRAVELALSRLILPELPHLRSELDK